MGKILEIRWCGDCRYNHLFPGDGSRCGNPDIQNGDKFFFKPIQLEYGTFFPPWCPLEDKEDYDPTKNPYIT